MDRMYAIVSLDILEMDGFVLSFFWLYNVFCAPVAKQEQFIAYALDILCCTNVNKFEK